MRSPLTWAFPTVVLLVGCGRGVPSPDTPAARQTTTTTTTVIERQPSAAPAPSATGGGPKAEVGTDAPQRLDPARVDRLVESRRSDFRNDCYRSESGVVSFILDVTIAPDGRVERATTASVDGSRDVAECVRGKIEKMTFPQTSEASTHTFTFLFGP